MKSRRGEGIRSVSFFAEPEQRFGRGRKAGPWAVPQETPMSLDARIPTMTEKELENLQANAERIIKSGAAKQKEEAERLLPLIAEALVELRKNKLAAAAEKKVTRQKEMAEGRARRAASKKAEAEAAAAPDEE